MRTVIFALLNILLLNSVHPGALVHAGEGSKPNIIIIFTDDQGYADLGTQGVVADVKTPHIDRLASEGVRCTSGYITAPQCIPSRAGLMTGKYQQRFGVGHNNLGPLPLDETILPERLMQAGYVTGIAGKWHLEPSHRQMGWIAEELPELMQNQPIDHTDIPESNKLPYYPSERGFEDCWWGHNIRYWVNYDLEGNDLEKQWVVNRDYRLDVQTEAALTFIRRNHESPFFLYLSYFAPHVPLGATEKYLERFPGEMPERRRYCLAMLSAIDDGVGKIMDLLDDYGIRSNTMIFFISDNGAPLVLHKEDLLPVHIGGVTWDGSLNDPYIGEKGMLSEGGIRVPFVVAWPDGLPRGITYDHPVSALDVAATAVAVSGLPHTEELDGVNLVPYLNGSISRAPHDALYWRFFTQAAIRKGKWKYLQAGSREYLFDLHSVSGEGKNIIAEYPQRAQQLKRELKEWADRMHDPGLPGGELMEVEKEWYDFYFGTK